MNIAETINVQYKGVIVGVGVCPKCMIINKIRNQNAIVDNICKCHSCGADITIKKVLSSSY